MIMIGCIVFAAVIHEMRNDRVHVLYELLFWMFVSYSMYFLLASALL
jgi:hypothetical protein